MGSKVHENSGRLASEKLRLFSESRHLKGVKRGEFLRKHGLHTSELELWEVQMRQGLDAEVIMRPDSKKAFREKIAKLEKELKEAQIIIETQKKVRKLLGAAGRRSQAKSKKKSSE